MREMARFKWNYGLVKMLRNQQDKVRVLLNTPFSWPSLPSWPSQPSLIPCPPLSLALRPSQPSLALPPLSLALPPPPYLALPTWPSLLNPFPSLPALPGPPSLIPAPRTAVNFSDKAIGARQRNLGVKR